MGQALYRKYRSKKLSEVVGQDHVTTALSNALKNNTISHAYLFTGPRGVGKTSIARILAHEVNRLPYDDASTHLDIIEIDAASNRRIDEIRTLRERVHNAPTSAKYKVYIIDEVHMLTKEAFNALLKTLEEPPAHVIFILATTEVHKLPETIISRTQRYSFKPAEPSAAIKHLRHIATEEGIDISDDALALIASHGGGSFRDSISLLDQVSNTGAVIDLAATQRMLGIAPDTAIANLTQLLEGNDAAALVDALTHLHQQGYQAPQIAKQLIQALRHHLLNRTLKLEANHIAELIRQLLNVPTAHDPYILLELALLEVVLAHKPTPPKPAMPAKVASAAPTVKATPPKPSAKNEAPTQPPSPAPTPQPPDQPPQPFDESAWQQTLQIVKQKHNTLYGIARMATPLFQDGALTLVFGFPFHQKRLNDAKNKQIMSDIITTITGQPITITCILDKTASNPTPPPATSTETAPAASGSTQAPIETISNIFGGAEMLE